MCIFFFDFIDCLTMFVTYVLVNSDALNGPGALILGNGGIVMSIK